MELADEKQNEEHSEDELYRFNILNTNINVII
jgi:hypothetical protein